MNKKVVIITKTRRLLRFLSDDCIRSRRKHTYFSGQATTVPRPHNVRKTTSTVKEEKTGHNASKHLTYEETIKHSVSRVCVYGIRFGHDGQALCTGLLNNKTIYNDSKGGQSLSMYIGTKTGVYFIKRKLYWKNDAFTLGPATQQFLRVFFGPLVKKVVYNDALEIASYLHGCFNIRLENILDLSYMHVVQEGLTTLTPSIALLDELKKAEEKPLIAVNKVLNKRPNKLLALRHLYLANKATQHLLGMQGHSEASWRQRVSSMIDTFLSHSQHWFYAEQRNNALEQGHVTPVTLRSHVQLRIERYIRNDTVNFIETTVPTLMCSVKSMSYAEKDVILNTNAFVISRVNQTLKPLYAIVDSKAFHQLSDLEIGETVEMVPTRNEKDTVSLIYLYDKVFCRATRLHGESLLYNLRTGKLVPIFTHPR